ncbi:MAG: carboxypeptidase regulatory-like domain-containing protein [Gammaproteobacteria bacterium]|nr:carboxypeptidase regulatory-like domain-containing protein [Gammaproteobacteria bacterium]
MNVLFAAARYIPVIFLLSYMGVPHSASAGGIKGQITRSDDGQPIPEIIVNAYHHVNGYWAGSAVTDVQGDYNLDGLTSGDYRIQVTSTSGINFVAEYYDDTEDWAAATPVSVATGSTTVDIDMALEFGFPHKASVMNKHHSDGSFSTYYSFVPSGYQGTLPNDFTTVTVETPVSHTMIDLIWDPIFQEFYGSGKDSPELGVHTFRATTAEGTVVSTDYQYVIRSLPIPDTASFSPPEATVLDSKTPSFSWKPVELPGVPLYYRFEIKDNATGLRVFASKRQFGMYFITLPAGTLSPGGSYRWRVRVTDSDSFETVQNRVQSDWVNVTVPSVLDNHDALPAIDPYNWNGLSWTGGNAFAASVAIVDRDGVAYDGSSHQVTITAPEGSNFPDGQHVKMMDFDNASAPDRANYWLWTGGGIPASGEYVFTVTDPDGNQTSFTEQVDIDPLNGPDEASLTPSNIEHHINASFDNVHVNGQPYDTFSQADGSQPNPALWKWVNNGTIAGNALVLDVRDSVGRGHASINFSVPLPINSVSSDITVNSISDSDSRARARIGGSFFNAGSNSDTWATVSYDADHVYYRIANEWLNHQGTYQWAVLQEGDLLAADVGDLVTMGITWDEASKTMSFTATNQTKGTTDSADYVHSGPVYPAISKNIVLQTRINLTTDTTPTFTWDPVPGASRYRVRIYNIDNSSTIWRGSTGEETSFTLPPGILEPNAIYRYRVEAWDKPSPLSIDNYTRTPISSHDYYRFYTNDETSDAPALHLDGGGVYTYKDGESGIRPSFWVRVHDRQGVPGNIAEVKVVLPTGYEEILDIDHTVSSTSAVYQGFSSHPVENGTYTFIVTDHEGHSASITDELLNAPIGFPIADSLTESLHSETIEFTWDAVSGTAFYRLHVYDEQGEQLFRLPAETPSFSLPLGLLEKGVRYRYRVRSFREFFSQLSGNDTMGNMDNVSSTPFADFIYPAVNDEDDDDDGMPDGYEETWGFQTLNPDDGLQDADGDGDSNLKEFKNGTSPRDPASNEKSLLGVVTILNILME